MISIKDFAKKYTACKSGLDWALENCSDMEEVWNKAKPEWLIWIATQDGVLTDRELHEFMLHCGNSVRHLLTDKRSIDALDAKRDWLDGKITDDELKNYYDNTSSAALDAARDAAWAAWAAWAAALDATRTARAAARAASGAAWAARAALDAAWAARAARAARDTALDAALDAAITKQAEWLRKNTTPNFNI